MDIILSNTSWRSIWWSLFFADQLFWDHWNSMRGWFHGPWYFWLSFEFVRSEVCMSVSLCCRDRGKCVLWVLWLSRSRWDIIMYLFFRGGYRAVCHRFRYSHVHITFSCSQKLFADGFHKLSIIFNFGVEHSISSAVKRICFRALPLVQSCDVCFWVCEGLGSI